MPPSEADAIPIETPADASPNAVDAYRDNGEFVVVVVCDEGTGISPRADSPGLGALEAAQRRSSGRFSRVAKPPAAANPGMPTSRRAPA